MHREVTTFGDLSPGQFRGTQRSRFTGAGDAAGSALFEPLEERLLLASFTVYDSNMALRGDNFQSHNQKVVADDNGILVTTGSRGSKKFPPGIHLFHSTDGGRTFRKTYSEKYPSNPPTLDTDEDNNVYLLFPVGKETRFLKFAAANG